MIRNQQSGLQLVKKILAADFACEEGDFDKEGVTIHRAKEIEGARRFPLPDKFLAVVTMGKGVVICCSANRLRWVRSNLNQFSPERLFYIPALALMQRYVSHDHQSMIGPDLKYICTKDTFRPFYLNKRINKKIEVSLIRGKNIEKLYENNKFPNALGNIASVQRPRLLACLAKYDEKVIGIAGASADSDPMWQIGIDTLGGYRNQGIGKALVSQLTKELLQKGILPYYSTGISNIASRRIATSLGYRPAWVEIYSREPPAPGEN